MTKNHEAEQPHRYLSPETISELQQLVDDVNESLERDRNRLSQRILRVLFPSRNNR
ncbi:uncharacterized protein (DUF1499 family) [Paeniglutamicibacter psychrophenolicus]|jgi:uncharacterized protein (DUF1499 family)|uniref:Uncharacterized protein (DUF1499 family) n=1 Tax=Paeniglutamicibacter psychrophenolicus TaxID=257454 RepID=A0ABS4WED9_9MICC|nr:uncharacterized protein (DUF1499 family) [Paeniglutamicibacter psychrophenolicus]MDQ0096029.1 uncharacterized protein (DUF1499 family) [Paeniglutamicibacter psychrophenolicus]